MVLPLTEDLTKNWLREFSLPVPHGAPADCSDEAASIAARMPNGAVVKALVPTGRRGKAGAVRVTNGVEECRAAARDLLGKTVNGHPVHRIYVEERIAIREEYYLSLSLRGAYPEIMITRSGGVDIEDVMRVHPKRLVRAVISPLHGLTRKEATNLMRQAGFETAMYPSLGALAVSLYDAFRKADALLLEINPFVLTNTGAISLVGAMMGIDENALFRHSKWASTTGLAALPANPRERNVAITNRQLPGGECQYVELDGDIGLLVGGGGAGLYQHDVMLELGGKPANHCVTPPTGSDNRKLKAVLSAILENPRLKGLLIGFNFAQMARTDIRISTLMEVLSEQHVGIAQLPIVIRLFGAGEEKSRAMIAGHTNIHYVPRGTTLKQAVRLIIELTSGKSTVSPR